MVSLRSKHVCFTIFADNVPEGWTPNLDLCTYLVYQWEKCPDSGRVHLQGYLELKNRMTFNKIKRQVLKTDTAHLEKRKGTSLEASDYCKKEDSRLEFGMEFGTLSKSNAGARTDLLAFKNAIGEKSLSYMIDNFTLEMARFGKFYDRVFSNVMENRSRTFRRLEVSIYWGKPGSGKTRSVYESYPYEEVYALTVNGKEKVWFDAYKGQDVLLLDDFYGNINHGFLLRLLDGYPLRLDQKGTHCYALFTKVFITSNLNPKLWYYQLWSKYPDLEGAFNRRITLIKHFT